MKMKYLPFILYIAGSLLFLAGSDSQPPSGEGVAELGQIVHNYVKTVADMRVFA